MSSTDSETKLKLREMGAQPLLEALEAQHDDHVVGVSFGERIQLVVDHAHESFNHSKIDGLIRRANLRYPAADLRRVDLVEERGLDRAVLANLATCSFIQRQQNVVFQGFTGSGKSYLGYALAKQACQHRIRAHYIRMPDLEEAWALAKDRPQGQNKYRPSSCCGWRSATSKTVGPAIVPPRRASPPGNEGPQAASSKAR